MASSIDSIPEAPMPEGSVYFSRPQTSRAGLAAAAVWLTLTVVLLVIGLRQALFVAPTEATMGNVQRIFYWHVPAGILALIFPYVNFAASLAFLYLRRRNPLGAMAADAVAIAAAEVTTVFATVSLVTGSLWGRPVWGIWWTWDPRLTSMLLLWLLYVAYLLTRRLSVTGQTSTVGAVLSIFAAVDVPIVYFSIQWWRTQHPSPVLTGDGHLDHAMSVALGWNVLAWAMWGVFLVAVRYALERRRQHAAMEDTLHSLEALLEAEPAQGNAGSGPRPEANNAL